MYNVLEEFGFELVVLNAQHMKAVPERKTEVKDSESICDLLRHGLLRASFIPSKEQRERRELVRYRKTMIRERADEVNRIQKVLEGANIKPAAVATDVLGVSGRQMLEAMIEGVQDPKLLASMAKGRLQAKQAALEAALAGIVGEHQRFLLWEQLSHLGELHARIERLSQESEKRTRPFEEAVQLLDTIPGVGQATAEAVVAEVGTDMGRFRSAAHLASWAALRPGNNESAGKRKSGRIRKGNPWLRETLVEAARSAARTKGTYLSAQYHRIAARRGAKQATVAVAHTILVMASCSKPATLPRAWIRLLRPAQQRSHRAPHDRAVAVPWLHGDPGGRIASHTTESSLVIFRVGFQITPRRPAGRGWPPSGSPRCGGRGRCAPGGRPTGRSPPAARRTSRRWSARR